MLTIRDRAENLVARVIQAGGTLQLDTEDDNTDYERLCKAAKQAPNLPFGKQLRTRKAGSWWSRQREIYLDEDFFVTVHVQPVPVPQRVATYHPVVVAYRADSDHQEVSRESLGRATRILQALAAEAARRGHTVKAPEQQTNQYTGAPVKSLKDGQLRMVVNGFTYLLRIREQSAKGGERLSYYSPRVEPAASLAESALRCSQQHQRFAILSIRSLDMAGFESAVLGLGIAASKALFASWLRGRTPGARPNETIAELLQRRVPESIQRRRAQRQLDQIADQITDQLQKFFKSEFPNVPKNEIAAATLLVGDIFNDVEADANFLLAADLDVDRIDRYLRRSGAKKIAEATLSEAGSFVFDQVLRETAAYVVEVFTVMPTFSAAIYRELLRRETAFETMVKQALAELPTADKQAEDRSAEDRKFETDYRRSIASKLDRLELFGVTLSEFSRRYSLSVAYISLSVTHQIWTQPYDPRRRLVQPEAVDATEESVERVEEVLGYVRQRVLIQGEAGSGKTTLLQWLSVMAARKEFSGGLNKWNDLIPVYLPLRRFASIALPRPEHFLDSVLPNLVERIPPTWVSRLLQSGRALLLLDGMDELPTSKRANFIEWLTDLITDFPQITVVVTSRPSIGEIGWFHHQKVESFELRPMSLRDIKALIDQWHYAMAKDVEDEDERASLVRFRENLKTIMEERRAIRLLATNPLMCALICALHRDRKAHLPQARMDLYRIALEMLLERRDKERQVPEHDINLTYRQKELILQDIAYWLIRNGQSDATVVDTAARLTKVLSNIPEIRQSATEILSYLIRRSGVLRSPTDGRIDFLHRSFEEFLAAKGAVDDSDIPLLIQNSLDDQWREVVILAVGHARPHEQELLIRGLLDRGRQERRNRHRLYLLAMSCMETSTQISPKLQSEVKRALARVVPPKNNNDATAIAATGDLAVPFLSDHSNLEPQVVAACVHALALIGGDYAMRIIKDYSVDRRSIVAREVIRSWPLFSAREYARSVLSRAPLDRGAIELIDSSYIDYLSILTRLRRVHAERVDGNALRRLGELPRLRHLDLRRVHFEDFLWLTNQRLETLTLEDSTVSSWEGLGLVPGLRRLSIRRCDGAMRDSVEDSGRLEVIELYGTRITSLRFLQGAAKSLKSLSIVECGNLNSLEGAGVLGQLEELILEDNSSLASIDRLWGLQNLRQVTIRGSHISDLSSLKSVPNLQLLRLDREGHYDAIEELSSRKDLKLIYAR